MPYTLGGSLTDTFNGFMLNSNVQYFMSSLFFVTLIISIVCIIILYNSLSIRKTKNLNNNLMKSFFYMFVFIYAILHVFTVINTKNNKVNGGRSLTDSIYNSILNNDVNLSNKLQTPNLSNNINGGNHPQPVVENPTFEISKNSSMN